MASDNGGKGTIKFEIKEFLDFMYGGEAKCSGTSIVRGLPWKIQAKPILDKKRYLSLYLMCNTDSKSPSWSCNASVKFRLLVQKGKLFVRFYEEHMLHNFNCNSNSFGYAQFIPLEKLVNAACKKDTVLLEVSIKTDAVLDPLETVTRFRYRVDAFKKFIYGREKRASPAVYIQGLPWNIAVEPGDMDFKNHTKYMKVFLQCNAGSNSTTWSCNAHARFRLIDGKNGSAVLDKQTSHMFTAYAYSHGYSQFIAFTITDGAVIRGNADWFVNDAVVLEVTVKAEPPLGDIGQTSALPLPSAPPEAASGQGECVVCLEKKLDCALVPCGHTCLCLDCAVKQKTDNNASCPICRGDIDNVFKIYVS